MCDYSLGNVPNRLAVEGEQLCVHQFDSGVKGLISAKTSSANSTGNWWSKIKTFFWEEEVSPVAVCVPPGAQLVMMNIPASLQQHFNLRAYERVTFTQLHAEAYMHRDAVRFSDGQEVLLQKLKVGQLLDVVQLSLSDEEPAGPMAAEEINELAYLYR
jgi:hypothetical protein